MFTTWPVDPDARAAWKRAVAEHGHGHDAFPGRSWIVAPEGEILAETSAESPFATVEVDLRQADSAKQTYPRNLSVPA